MVSELNILVMKWSKIAADFALFCMEELVWSPSYYSRGALKTGGWVQSVHRPRVEPSRGRVYAWTRVHMDAWTRQPPDYFFSFLDKTRELSKIVSVLQSASVERFNVSHMRDFFT